MNLKNRLSVPEITSNTKIMTITCVREKVWCEDVGVGGGLGM